MRLANDGEQENSSFSVWMRPLFDLYFVSYSQKGIPQLKQQRARVAVGILKCSGLEVMRYDADSLHDQFGARFRLIESSQELHETPQGATQQFLYCYCRVE
jgi:hypothetical protein